MPRIVAAMAVLAATSWAAQGTAGAATPITQCGQELSSNTTYELNADLGPCPSPALPDCGTGPGDRRCGGLVVNGRSSVTIDLKGNRLIGDFNPLNPGNVLESCAVSIVGSSAVTVKNGTILGFVRGVCLESTSSSRVENLTISGREIDVGPEEDLGPGVWVSKSTGNVVTGNKIVGSAFAAGIHVSGDSDTNTVQSNMVMGSGRYGILLDAALSAEDTGAPDGNDVLGNTVIGNGQYGILIAPTNPSYDTTVTSASNLIQGNIAEGNANGGIVVGSDGVVETLRYAVKQSATFPFVSASPTSPGQPDANQVATNLVCANPGNGIAVYSAGNTITGNHPGDLSTVTGALSLTGTVPAHSCLPNGVFDLFDHVTAAEVQAAAPGLPTCNNTWTSNNVTASTKKNLACIG